MPWTSSSFSVVAGSAGSDAGQPAAARRRAGQHSQRGRGRGVRSRPPPSWSAPTWSTSSPCSSGCRWRSSRPSPTTSAGRGAGPSVCRSVGGVVARRRHQRMGRPRPAPRAGGDLRRRRLGACDRRLRARQQPAAGAGDARPGGRGRHDQRIYRQTIGTRPCRPPAGRLAGIEMLSYSTGRCSATSSRASCRAVLGAGVSRLRRHRVRGRSRRGSVRLARIQAVPRPATRGFGINDLGSGAHA